MLTPFDISFMEQTVQDIVVSWRCSAKIIRAKPIEEQTNWNPILREYTGDVEYDIIENVPCERKDIANTNNEKPVAAHSGLRNDGEIMYAFPAYYNSTTTEIVDGEPVTTTKRMELKLYDNDIMEFSDLSPNGEQWQIRYIRHRIGEYVISVIALTGGTISGADALAEE